MATVVQHRYHQVKHVQVNIYFLSIHSTVIQYSFCANVSSYNEKGSLIIEINNELEVFV